VITYPFGKSSTDKSEGELEAGICQVDVSLLNFLRVSSSVQNSGQEVSQDTVTSPLCEDGENNVASNPVSARSVLEERTVIPPALISAVKLKELLILGKL